MSTKSENKNKKPGLKVIIAVAVVVLIILGVYLLTHQVQEAAPLPADVAAQAEAAAQQSGEPERILNNSLEITEIGEYTGLYVEDGTDEAVSGVLMMKVKNLTAEPVQYARITLAQGSEMATFDISVLPAGATAMVIEKNRMAYSAEFETAQAECLHLAGFDKALSLQEDKLEIQLLDGALNITNISGQDIDQTIVLCYKNISDGEYLGGIAYRIKLEDGLKAGEVRQIMASHFHQPGSELLFVDFAG